MLLLCEKGFNFLKAAESFIFRIKWSDQSKDPEEERFPETFPMCVSKYCAKNPKSILSLPPGRHSICN